MPASDIPRYNIVKDEIKGQLDQIAFRNIPEKKDTTQRGEETVEGTEKSKEQLGSL